LILALRECLYIKKQGRFKRKFKNSIFYMPKTLKIPIF